MLKANIRTNWDPWQEFGRIQNEMNRVFSGVSGAIRSSVAAYPPLNVHSGDDRLVITAEVAGIDPQKIDITVTGEALTIKGERPAEQIAEKEKYHRRERVSGPFSRTLELPFEVDASRTEAQYKNGILQVVLYRPEEEKPRKITVNTAE